jgi:hypothetical protein
MFGRYNQSVSHNNLFKTMVIDWSKISRYSEKLMQQKCNFVHAAEKI